jgi:hypothetical protein
LAVNDLSVYINDNVFVPLFFTHTWPGFGYARGLARFADME